MRVTTQMVNDSAQRAGLPGLSRPLLDGIEQYDKKNSLLGAKGSKTNTGSRTLKEYEALEKYAVDLKSLSEKFSDQEDGNTEELKQTAENLVETYNKTCKSLRTGNSTLDQFYLTRLKDVAAEYKEGLLSVGISVEKDGLLSINKEKLGNADRDSLINAFGGESKFGERIGFIGERIADNASKMAGSISNRYGSDGNISSMIANRYDWIG